MSQPQDGPRHEAMDDDFQVSQFGIMLIVSWHGRDHSVEEILHQKDG